jgi:farnesyl diphosphate synthase
MTFDDQLQFYQARTERRLAHWLPDEDILPPALHRAMRYSTLGGGKRLRPVLVYATGVALGVPLSRLDGPACAVELIHAYSLVHDDLPAMDDDALRRGKPTCHLAFDEATAILAGDALQSLAFYVLAHDSSMIDDAAIRLEMIERLAQASGSRGMAGGQAMDLAAEGQVLNFAELENLHIHKTGALIRASVLLGALSCSDLDAARRERLDHYAKCIGLAFQIQDDILDVEGDTAVLGKPQGSDQHHNKATYPALLGLDAARQRAQELCAQAIRSLEWDNHQNHLLIDIARYIIARQS